MSTLSVNNITEVGGDAVVTSGVLDSGSLPTGTVLQVVSTTKTDTFSESVTANTFTGDITGLTASITPASTSNKIVVFVTVSASRSDGYAYAVGRVLRNGTPIAVGDSAGSRTPVSFSAAYDTTTSDANTSGASIVDSPSTTSSVTYSVQLMNKSGGTNTIYVNRSSSDTDTAGTPRYVSSITLMEIAG